LSVQVTLSPFNYESGINCLPRYLFTSSPFHLSTFPPSHSLDPSSLKLVRSVGAFPNPTLPTPCPKAPNWSLSFSLSTSITDHPTVNIEFLSPLCHIPPSDPVLTSSIELERMGAKDVLTRKTGVIVGDDVLNLFKYAKEKGFAIPAIVCAHLSVCCRIRADNGRTSPPPQPWSLPWRLLVMQMRQ
jgi:hypothetical protein